MTVATFDPNSVLPVSFSEKALVHLAKQVEAKNAIGLQFDVKESGCSGYKYLLELAFDADEKAQKFELDNQLPLYILPEVLPLIRGTQVDYIQEGVNFRLDFNNPNATALCGCGESFTVEQQ